MTDTRNTICEWFARCENVADGVVSHPILGLVPTCSRCAAKLDLELRAWPCEYESPAVRDFDGSGWVSFDCDDEATVLLSFVDETLRQHGAENVWLRLCATHADEIEQHVSDDDNVSQIEREAIDDDDEHDGIDRAAEDNYRAHSSSITGLYEEI